MHYRQPFKFGATCSWGGRENFCGKRLVVTSSSTTLETSLSLGQSFVNLSVVDSSCNPGKSGGEMWVKVLHLNIQSMRNKLHELAVLLDEADCDVLLVNEHWLLYDEVTLYVPRGYKLAAAYCRDEPYGGSSILLKEHFSFEIIDISHLTSTRFLEAVCIYVGNLNVIFVSLYRTPDTNSNTFFNYLESLLHFVCDKKPKSYIVLGADFNIDFLMDKDVETVTLVNLLKSFDLYHANSIPTRQKRLIDNIVTNIDKNCFESSLWNYQISDHGIINFKFCVTSMPSQVKHISFRKSKETDFNLFVQHLSKFDWHALYKIDDSNVAFEFFVNNLKTLYDFFCPRVQKTIKVQSHKKAVNSKWFDETCHRMRNIVNTLRDMLKIPTYRNNAALKNCYNVQRRRYREKIKDAKIKCNDEFINNASNKCLAAWNVIKSESGNHFKKDNLLPLITPEQFNDHYINIGKGILLRQQIMSNSSISYDEFLKKAKSSPVNFLWNKVNEQQVFAVVKALKSSNCEDIFGFSNKIIKLIVSFIIKPLTYVINLSLSFSHFPDCLKISKSIPLFKKGDRTCMDNYRTITIVSVFSKILETCAKEQILEFLDVNKILSSSQFGFRPGYSTVKALDDVVSQILSGFEAHEYLGMTLLDLSKAFDSISHDILLNKLEYYGIRNDQLSFFRAYLCGRLHMVCVGDQYSSRKEVLAGVPQGSVLGPLLFILYMNDLPISLSCKTILYADDTSLIVKDNYLASVLSDMNRVVNKASLWLESNLLRINESKTELILFSLRHFEIDDDISKPVKLLGVSLDHKLVWDEHTNNLTSKLSRVCFLLKKLKSCVSNDLMKTAYFSFFHSHLLYANMLWGNSVGADRIFIWQKRALRIMFGLGYRESCRNYFTSYNIMTVPCIFIFQNLIYVRENITNFIKFTNVHNYHTRHANDLVLPVVRLEKYAKSHKYLQIKFFNKLPEAWRLLNIKEFKTKVSKWMIRQAFYSVEEFLNS
uniref:Reverse transcriptase domain-containing protein n=1 Tax=Graphocephala atropunctata TaxID=36148 RepID=A0A1B6LWG4_9HEMI